LKDNDNGSNTNSSIKLNNLIWNHKKCEVEYRDSIKDGETFLPSQQNTNNNNNNINLTIATTTNNNNIYKRQNSVPEVCLIFLFKYSNVSVRM
jgi:hypothetical protein